MTTILLTAVITAAITLFVVALWGTSICNRV
ncbi:hypothetical protein ASALC70_04023 [Alcanivorax sp. ALC70]|nr:hypothetical protein ASALC70_04023 [Alcanivorax sp. ALC70]